MSRVMGDTSGDCSFHRYATPPRLRICVGVLRDEPASTARWASVPVARGRPMRLTRANVGYYPLTRSPRSDRDGGLARPVAATKPCGGLRHCGDLQVRR